MVSQSATHRVDREKASERLVLAVIDLLSSGEASDLTIDGITEHAGLASGHVLVHRYFGSRAGFFSHVARLIAHRIINEIESDLEGLSITEKFSIQELLLPWAHQVENVRKRAILIAELQKSGHDPVPHAIDTQGIISKIAETMVKIGLNERPANITALKVYSLVVMDTTHHQWIGATQNAREDLRNLVMAEIANANEYAKTLGW